MRQLKITKSITNRESASLDKYLQEIGREDLITVEEEVELAQAIKRGDRRALEKLTRANLRFVVSVAKQYQNQGLSLPDLINEGNLGLIKAAEKFDETRGFKFISYAVWWIRQSILQALAEQSRIVRLPLNQVHKVWISRCIFYMFVGFGGVCYITPSLSRYPQFFSCHIVFFVYVNNMSFFGGSSGSNHSGSSCSYYSYVHIISPAFTVLKNCSRFVLYQKDARCRLQ